MVNIKDMVGKTFVRVEVDEDKELRFYEKDGSYYRFYHYQDCCEYVYIKDIVGDLKNLEGEPLLVADVSANKGDGDNNSYDSSTWTFYKFATTKGWVDISWWGESNGYYSEDVDLMYVRG